MQDTRQQVAGSSRLKAALCEMAVWESFSRAEIDSLLLLKASYLREAGEAEDAYATLCRVQRFGLTEEQRADLLRRKLICTWEAGLMDEFRGLLDEAAAEAGGIDQAAVPDEAIAPAMAPATALSWAVATASNLSGKPRHRSPDAAMLLSVIPGGGLAYAGDWAAAGKYFAAGIATVALGTGAFISGLYVTAFLGGGMLLYAILPPSTDRAVKGAASFNDRALKEYYIPVYEGLKSRNL